MDEYYEWIKELLKEEKIDLDALTTTTDPQVLTHIHEAVRDLRDSLELVRQDIGCVEQGIYSKVKRNKCAIHGDQLVISESDTTESNGKKAASTDVNTVKERPIDKLPKKIKERHVSGKTKCLYLGLPYYYTEPSEETESPDSSDLEEIKNKCKRLKERYQLLQQRKFRKVGKAKVSKVSSASQTNSDALSTLEYSPKKQRSTNKFSSPVKSVAVKKSDRQPRSRSPPKPTKYISPELVRIDYTKKDSSDEQLSVASETDSAVLCDRQLKQSPKSIKLYTGLDTTSKKNDEKKQSKTTSKVNTIPDQKKKSKKKKNITRVETGIQTSPDKEVQKYAKSCLLRSDRPKSARPERRLLRLNKFMCFAPEQFQAEENLEVIKTHIDDGSEKTINSSPIYEIKQSVQPKEQQNLDESALSTEKKNIKKKKYRSQSCPRESTSNLSSTDQESLNKVTKSKNKKTKKLKKDFSSQTDLLICGSEQKVATKTIQFGLENLYDIDRTPIVKKSCGSQTDLTTENKPVGILKRTLTDPSLVRPKPPGLKPKFVSIVDSGSQTYLDRAECTSNIETSGEKIVSHVKKIGRSSPDSQYLKEMQQTSSTSSNMAARIDLHIKVSSNVQVDGGPSEVETESDTAKDEKSTEKDQMHKQKASASTSNRPSNLLKEETLTVDNQKLTIRVISEENLYVTQSNDGEIDVKRSSTENLDIEQLSKCLPDAQSYDDKHLDIDELSIHSMSEGDNSVFTDGRVTPTEPDVGAVGGETRSTKPSNTDNQEEVDDIELIFSSDENKDYGQDDLVSISEYEPWQEGGTAGTPILLKFKKTASVETKEREERGKVKPRPKKQDTGAQTNKDYGEDTQKSIESTDSFSYDLKHFSEEYTTKTPCLEKDSSTEQEVISREESFDTFEQAISSAIQRRWTKASILVETDISKCGITEEIKEETLMGFPRRNTCPNPAPYRPIINPSARQKQPLGVKFIRSPRTYASHFQAPKTCLRPKISETETDEQRCSSAVQTDISALPPQWRSESHLSTTEYGIGLYTLPSKYETPIKGYGSQKCPLRLSEKTQENRRVLLSDINFTSMVPELSRSADHICHEDDINDENKSNEYYKGNLLQTPEYTSKGLTPSYSLTSPGISNWTVNEGSQTTQTGGYWDRGDSFDSSKSYSMQSNNLEKHHRSRSVPSIRCMICRQTQLSHNVGMRVSESMNYGPRISHHDNASKCRGSLPDLRHHCNCRRYDGPLLHKIHAESEESAESLVEETEDCFGVSSNSIAHTLTLNDHITACSNRRRSENDIGRHFTPPACQVPFLPSTPESLKTGNLAKVILKSGRVAVGRIRFVGKIDHTTNNKENVFVGLQLPAGWGDSDGTFNNRRIFDCPPLHGVFVPFSKIIMAWNV